MYIVDEELRYQDGSLAVDRPVAIYYRGTSTATVIYTGYNSSYGAINDGLGTGSIIATPYPDNATLRSDSQGRIRCMVDSSEALDIVVLTDLNAEEARFPIEPFAAGQEPMLYPYRVGRGGFGWREYGQGWEAPRAYLTSEGFVCMEGLVVSYSTLASGILFSLPARLRPALPKIALAIGRDNSPAYLTARIDIQTAGTVVVTDPAGFGVGGWVSLAGIRFPLF